MAKALALAEAGLRISLGQDAQRLRSKPSTTTSSRVRRAIPGFDQLLHDTEAGQALREVFGGPAPTDEPVDLRWARGSWPRASSAPRSSPGAGPFGLHGILVFDRILDGDSAAVATRYVIPNNTVRSAKAVLSGRLVVLNLAQPEGPYVPTTIDVDGAPGPPRSTWRRQRRLSARASSTRARS